MMLRRLSVLFAGVVAAMAILPPVSIADMDRAGVRLPRVRMLPPDAVTEMSSGEGARWALVIGIGKFTGRTRPNPGSAGDAFDVRDLLVRNGWPESQIRVLTDAGATGKDIRDGLGWLRSVCVRSSSCVFHYSGHVKQLRANDGDAETVDEALWSHNNVFIPDGEVAGYLRSLPNAWINISGCEAAGFDDGVSGPYRLVTASSQEHEKSYEHPEWKNSIFTGLFVDQGMLRGAADFNHDGAVSRSEAVQFSFKSATQITRGQSRGPQTPYIAGGGAGDWILPSDSGFRRGPAVRPSWPPCVMGIDCHWSGRAGTFVIL